MLNQISNAHKNVIKLWYLVQHSTSSFQKLVDFFGSVDNAVLSKNLLQWNQINIHKNHIQRAHDFVTNTNVQKEFDRLINTLKLECDFICIPQDLHYPQQLLDFPHYPPILFGQGDVNCLNLPQIAIVGSRKVSPHGQQISYDFAFYLAEKGFFITSGLAEGVDEAAHKAGLEHSRTIAVMATGIESTYPKKNRILRKHIVENGGCVITEFLPFTSPLKAYFPRRNRIVSGLSLAVLVAEATLKSGSLTTAKHAAEQGKIIFAIPGHIYAHYHEGCHALIRDGATLVHHPEQVLQDICLPAQWQLQKNQQPNDLKQKIDIPAHLLDLFEQLDWVGQDLDTLVTKTNQPVHHLIAQLMELELLGTCAQKSGLYVRC